MRYAGVRVLRLENRRVRKGLVGSNPTLSAIKLAKNKHFSSIIAPSLYRPTASKLHYKLH